MPHWSPRFVVSFLFNPEVAIPVIIAALGIAFTVALAPTMRNIRLAHWFFAIAGIWAYCGILRWLSGGDIQMKYLISFVSCGLVGTLWLASYVWVEGNHREQAQQQDKPTESKPDKKDEGKKKDAPASLQKKDEKHKTPPQVSQESRGDKSPNVATFGDNSPATVTINPDVDPNAPPRFYEFNGIKHVGGSANIDRETGQWSLMQRLEQAAEWPRLKVVAERERQLTPNWPTPYFYLGEANARLGNTKDALLQLKDFLKRSSAIAEDAAGFGEGYIEPRKIASDLIDKLSKN